MTYFPGTPHESRICPRRQVKRHPDAMRVLELYHDTEGRLGVTGPRDVSPHAVQGFGVLHAARAARAKADEEQAKREAEAKARRGKR